MTKFTLAVAALTAFASKSAHVAAQNDGDPICVEGKAIKHHIVSSYLRNLLTFRIIKAILWTDFALSKDFSWMPQV